MPDVGELYLGRRLDLGSGAEANAQLLYDRDDLTTSASRLPSWNSTFGSDRKTCASQFTAER